MLYIRRTGSGAGDQFVDFAWNRLSSEGACALSDAQFVVARAHARSTREHRATLLHDVAANGAENYRQKTPANIVPIAETILKAGAEADAVADMYCGGATTLGLAATSIHPLKAGVQTALKRHLVAEDHD